MSSPKWLKGLKFILIITLASATILFVWFHLPLDVQRHSEIQTGETIVQQLNKYHLSTHKFPESGDWKKLEKLGFKTTYLGTQPDYKKVSDTSYELKFMKGFDGPYLTYHSVSKKWSIE